MEPRVLCATHTCTVHACPPPFNLRCTFVPLLDICRNSVPAELASYRLLIHITLTIMAIIGCSVCERGVLRHSQLWNPNTSARILEVEEDEFSNHFWVWRDVLR
eukprot:1141434-Pelagomonas_calceolata.AAC.3